MVAVAAAAVFVDIQERDKFKLLLQPIKSTDYPLVLTIQAETTVCLS